jgi:hypothetical protein
MARRFVDARGTEWEVWEVTPRPVPADAPPPRPWHDRKAAEGWLMFESATQSRRLTGYPPRWHALDDAELTALCSVARLESPPPVLRIVVGMADVR